MKYNNQTPQPILNEYIKRNDERWEQLNSLILSVISDGVKYLFLVNAGGCIAMLTFLGTSSELRDEEWTWNVLYILFVGVVFVGVLHFSRYHVLTYLQDKWNHDVVKFYEGITDYDALSSNDDKRVNKTQWILVFAYLAFACFIFAGYVGFDGYKKLVKKDEAKMEQAQKNKTVIDEQKNHVPRPAPVAPPPQPPK
jgi:hypothetical protein